MKRIEHQLSSKDYYIPNWPVKHLFLGTFNPTGGDKVNYHYGRNRNQLWPLLREITGSEFNLEIRSEFFEDLKHHGIACMDMIHSVSVPADKIDHVLGKGYNDSKIINGYTNREYNTPSIQEVIQNNTNIRVYSTWGKGQSLKEWQNEVAKIQGVVPLVSPSMAARVPKGANKFEFMLKDWKTKIKIT